MQEADANGDAMLDISEFILWYNAAVQENTITAGHGSDTKSRRLTVSSHRASAAPSKNRRTGVKARRVSRKTKNYMTGKKTRKRRVVKKKLLVETHLLKR